MLSARSVKPRAGVCVRRAVGGVVEVEPPKEGRGDAERACEHRLDERAVGYKRYRPPFVFLYGVFKLAKRTFAHVEKILRAFDAQLFGARRPCAPLFGNSRIMSLCRRFSHSPKQMLRKPSFTTGFTPAASPSMRAVSYARASGLVTIAESQRL